MSMRPSKRSDPAMGLPNREGQPALQELSQPPEAHFSSSPSLPENQRPAAEEEAVQLALELLDNAWPHPSNPMYTARKFAETFVANDRPTLVKWGDSWMLWKDGSWSEVTQGWVMNRLWLDLENAWFWEGRGDDAEPKDWNPSTAEIRDVLNALAAVAEVRSDLLPGEWIEGVGPVRPIVLRNGILDPETRSLQEHDPRLFNLSRLPFDYDPDAPPPTRFLQFLDSLWPEGHSSIALVQECFGWAISGRTDLEKIVMIIGPPRGGKGVTVRVLVGILGEDNVAGITLASFGEQFGLSTMVGKTLTVIHDARLGKQNPERVVERLLTISGNGELPVDMKYR